jgi:hypothetical protein
MPATNNDAFCRENLISLRALCVLRGPNAHICSFFIGELGKQGQKQPVLLTLKNVNFCRCFQSQDCRSHMIAIDSRLHGNDKDRGVNSCHSPVIRGICSVLVEGFVSNYFLICEGGMSCGRNPKGYPVVSAVYIAEQNGRYGGSLK